MRQILLHFSITLKTVFLIKYLFKPPILINIQSITKVAIYLTENNDNRGSNVL